MSRRRGDRRSWYLYCRRWCRTWRRRWPRRSRMGGGRRARRCRRRGSLAAQLGCAPGTVARAYGELRRAGLIAARDRARARVADGGSPRARWWLAGGRRLRLAGSDDPALDALVRAAGEAVEVVSRAAGQRSRLGGDGARTGRRCGPASAARRVGALQRPLRPPPVGGGGRRAGASVAARGGVGRCARQPVGGARGRRPGRPARGVAGARQRVASVAGAAVGRGRRRGSARERRARGLSFRGRRRGRGGRRRRRAGRARGGAGV